MSASMGNAVYEGLTSYARENSVLTGLIATATIGVVWYVCACRLTGIVTDVHADG
jgi:hypothetical protein